MKAQINNNANLQIKRFDFLVLRDFAGNNNDANHQFEELPTKPSIMQPEIEVAPPEPSFSQNELEQASKAAYERGLEDGKNAAISAQQQLEAQNQAILAQQLQALDERLKIANEVIQEQIEAREQMLVQLAFSAARKLAGEAVSQNTLPILADMINQCLPHILQHPNVKIKLNNTDANYFANAISAQLEANSYKGGIEITTDSNAARGDIKIEWQFGEASRSMEALIAQLDSITPSLPINYEASSENDSKVITQKPTAREALAARAARINKIKEQ